MDAETRKSVLEGILFPLALLFSAYLTARSFVAGSYAYFKVPAEVIAPGMGAVAVGLAAVVLFLFVFSPLITSLMLFISKNEIVRVVFWFLLWWAAYTFFAGYSVYVTLVMLAAFVYFMAVPLVKYLKLQGSYSAKLAKKTADDAGVRVKAVEYLQPRYKILAVSVLVLCIGAFYAGSLSAKNTTDYTYIKSGDTANGAYVVVGKYKDSFVCKYYSWKKGIRFTTTRLIGTDNVYLGQYVLEKVKKAAKKKKKPRKKK